MTNETKHVSKYRRISNLEKVNVFVSRSPDLVGRSLSLRHAAATTMYAVKQCKCIKDRTLRFEKQIFSRVYHFPTKHITFRTSLFTNQ